MLREEEWVNGNPLDATSYLYDKEKNYVALKTPGLKGFPMYNFTSLTNYLAPHNVTRITKFDGNAAGNWNQISDESYSYQ